MSEIIRVPLHLLSITSTNARKDHIADKAMIASLKAQGLLYPLLVRGIEASESYDVVDGARRLTCILTGIQQGELELDTWQSLPCILSNGDARSSGLEQSLHANLHQAMHPLDECEAILRLAEDEEDKAAIALRFGQDERWLEQRVKLAGLAPEVKELFRAGEISLAEAMKFTLGDHAKQKAFLKSHAREGFTPSMIEPAMTDKWVSYHHCNFDLDQYTGGIERDLFGESIWLLNRPMVKELQDKWAEEEIEALKQQGYDKVEILPQDDWQTLQNTVEVTGRISAEVRATLACYLKADHYGLIVVHKNRISRKKVDDKGKIKKKAQSADETPAENVKPMVCTELTPAQQEIINALAASDLYTRIEEGDELLAQFMVIDRHLGQGFWTGFSGSFGMSAPLRRWERLNKDYPAETLINAAEIEPLGLIEPKDLSYADFLKMTPKVRKTLFLRACASLVMAPYGTQELKKDLPELEGRDWLVPGSDFFKRYRTDQLIDYRRRSGDRDAGKTVKKKGDHVADCVVAATTPGAFKLGLYPKKLQIPVSGKKRKGGLPDET